HWNSIAAALPGKQTSRGYSTATLARERRGIGIPEPRALRHWNSIAAALPGQNRLPEATALRRLPGSAAALHSILKRVFSEFLEPIWTIDAI
ncbi:hypothetical protein TorRG33x02_336130, partial [Trema orientale]